MQEENTLSNLYKHLLKLDERILNQLDLFKDNYPLVECTSKMIRPELTKITNIVSELIKQEKSTNIYKTYFDLFEDLKSIFKENIDINKYTCSLTSIYNQDLNFFNISGYIYLKERNRNNDYGFICRFSMDSHEELEDETLIERKKYKLNMLTSTHKPNKIKSWNNDKAFDTISDLKNDFLTWIKQNIS